MYIFYLASSFSSLFVLNSYFLDVVGTFGTVYTGYIQLLVFLLLASLLLLWRLCVASSISVRHSTFFLLLFISYFVFRMLIDLDTLTQVRVNTISTSGGIILFYLVGVLVANISVQNLNFCIASRRYFKLFTLSFLIYFCYYNIFLYNIVLEAQPNLRSDIFLLTGNNVNYQRPGNFLILSYFVIVSLYMSYALSRRYHRLAYRNLTNIVILGLFFLSTGLLIYISQMIGSNKGTVLVLFTGGLFVTILMYLLSDKANVKLNFRKLKFNDVVLGFVTYGLLKCSIVLLTVLCLLVYVLSVNDIVNLSNSRLGGYGEGGISSVYSRVELLNNFFVHFSYSPIFGNMNVDCLTTGCGTYVHSFLLSIVTHTGLLGLLFLALYFIIAFRENLAQLDIKDDTIRYWTNNVFYLNSILFLTFSLTFAFVGTFLTWIVIWFAMGAFFQPITTKNYHN